MIKSSLEKTTLVSYKRKGVETPGDVLAGKEPPRCLSWALRRELPSSLRDMGKGQKDSMSEGVYCIFSA